MTDHPPSDAPKKRHRLRTPQGWNAFMDEQRAAAPHRFITAPDGLGPDFLFVENVAAMLGCNVDHVRRIPRAALPASKVGQRLIYARSDVEAFIRAASDAGSTRHVASRKPRLPRRATPTIAPAGTFDPVAHVQSLLKGGEK